MADAAEARVPATEEHKLIAIRAQDFHEGLREVAAFGPKEAHLQKTLLIGKVATLATHLKGLNYVENQQSLTYLAAELGISGLELDRVLNELEVVDFAKVLRSGSEIRRVELRVPELSDGYSRLGERWTELKPGDVERAALGILQHVIEVPRLHSEVLRHSGVDANTLETILSIGSAGSLLDSFGGPNDEPLVYSPLTVEEDPKPLIELAKRFPETEVIQALGLVHRQQGIPETIASAAGNSALVEAVLAGVLCAVRIETPRGEHRFLFAPRGGLRAEERVVLDKARAILASVRYGQHFADNRRVFDPRAILHALRERKRFQRSRSDFPEQYGLLVTKQIAQIDPDTTRPGFFNLRILDTEENLKALNIAIDLLDVGEAPASLLDHDARTLLGVAGSYGGALPTRTRLARAVKRSARVARDVVLQLSKLIRGVV